MDSDLQGDGVFGEPVGEFVLGKRAVGEVEEGEVDLPFWRDDVPAVSVQKRDGNDQRGTFVSVNKSVISGYSEGVRRCEPEDIRLVGVGKDGERFRQGGVEKRLVADTVGAAMFSQLSPMHGQDGLL